MKADFLPCPFCGGQPEPFGRVAVKCTNCGARALASMWNERAKLINSDLRVELDKIHESIKLIVDHVTAENRRDGD